MGVTLQGYPDYQRVSAQSGDVIWTGQQPIGNNMSSGVQDAHGYSYLNVSVNDIGGTGYFWVQVAWSVNSDGSNQPSTYAFTPTPGGQQTLQVPVIARYFEINVGWVAGPKTDDPVIVVFGCNAIANQGINSQPGLPIMSYSKAIAGTTTDTAYGTTTIQGGATLAFNDSGGSNYQLFIDFYNFNLPGWQDMLVFFGSQMGASFTEHIGVPPAPLRVRTVNGDAGAHTFTFSITIDS